MVALRASKIGLKLLFKMFDDGRYCVGMLQSLQEQVSLTGAERIKNHNESLAEQEASIMSLARAFNAAGGYAMDHASLKVIKGFAGAGIMRPATGFSPVPRVQRRK